MVAIHSYMHNIEQKGMFKQNLINATAKSRLCINNHRTKYYANIYNNALKKEFRALVQLYNLVQLDAIVEGGEKITKVLPKREKKAEATGKTSREDYRKKIRKATGRSTVGRK